MSKSSNMNLNPFNDSFNMKPEGCVNFSSDCQVKGKDLEEQKQMIEASSGKVSNLPKGPFHDPKIAAIIQEKDKEHLIQTNGRINEEATEINQGKSPIQSPKLDKNKPNKDQNVIWVRLCENLSKISEYQTHSTKEQEDLGWEIYSVDGKKERCVQIDLEEKVAGEHNWYQDQIRLAANEFFDHMKKIMRKEDEYNHEDPKEGKKTTSKAKSRASNELEGLYFEGCQIIQVLGQGSHGIVLKIRDKMGIMRAVKLFNKKHPYAKRLFNQEKALMIRLDNPVIIRETAEFYAIVMRAGLGTLKDFGRFVRLNKIKITDGDIIHLFETLATQLGRIFSVGYAHRDIKPDNIVLFSASLCPMIIDFSCAVSFETSEGMRGWAGTRGYIAPHIYEHKKKSLTKEDLISGDLVSLGITLLELAIPDYKPIQNDPDLKKTLSQLSKRPAIYELLNKLLFPPQDFQLDLIERLRETYSLNHPAGGYLMKHYSEFTKFLNREGSNISKTKWVSKEMKQAFSMELHTDTNPDFTTAMYLVRTMLPSLMRCLLDHIMKAADIFKETNNSEQELVCYEYIIKCYLKQNKLKETSIYMNKCFKMAFEDHVACHSLLYSTLGIYYFLKKDLLTAQKMFSIGLERCEDDLAKIILLNNDGCLLWKEDQIGYGESFKKAYHMIEKSYLEVVNSLIWHWPEFTVINTLDSVAVQWPRIVDKRFHEAVLAIRGFSLIHKYSGELIIWPIVLNICVAKAYCLVNILKKREKKDLLERIQDFCSYFYRHQKVTPRLQGNLETFVKMVSFAEIIVNNIKDDLSGPSELIGLLKQAQLLNNQNELENLYNIFEKDDLGLSIRELKCKDLLFIMIGLTMIYRNPKRVQERLESQILEEKLRFVFQFKSSVCLSSKSRDRISQMNNLNRTIPKHLEKYIGEFKYQMELNNSSQRPFLLTLKSVDMILSSLRANDVEEIVELLKMIKDVPEIKLNLVVSAKLSDKDFIDLSKILSRFKSVNLQLNFTGTVEFTEGQVEQLAAAISFHGKQLKDLRMYIQKSLISSKGIEPLERAIGELQGLKRINLSFESCPNITDAVILSLEGMVRGLSSLEVLAIKFRECENIHTDQMKELEMRLKSFLKSAEIEVFLPTFVSRMRN